jgi:RimJ/RimL family protein N-acetyltransferase
VRPQVLRDGRTVVLREPTMQDQERTRRFFLALPPEDQRYLRADVTRREVVERRIRQAQAGGACWIVALVEDEIVADGALEFSRQTRTRHLGEIRVIVAPDYRGLSLGTLLIEELLLAAQRCEVQKVVLKMALPQIAARQICERLGFQLDAVLPDNIRHPAGRGPGAVVMSCTLDEVSRELRGFYRDDDWPDG